MPFNTSITLAGLTLLERGWLSSNNIVLHGAPGEGAVLVDTGHCTHAAQTVGLVRHALAARPGGEALVRIVNTHLHSDHCGGNAALQAAFPGVPVDVPPGGFDVARDWDESRLSHCATSQRCERFAVRGQVRPGHTLAVGTRRWEVIAAPGHDPDSVMLFDATHGVLISADALWQHGFGVVFPELEGESAFSDAGAVFDVIESLAPQLVIPGHGAAFTDVPEALARARQRLTAWRANPVRHARHAARVLIKYHLMEETEQAHAEVLDWAAAAPLLHTVWQRAGQHEDASLRAWAERLLGELVVSGALRREGHQIHDAG